MAKIKKKTEQFFLQYINNLSFEELVEMLDLHAPDSLKEEIMLKHGSGKEREKAVQDIQKEVEKMWNTKSLMNDPVKFEDKAIEIFEKIWPLMPHYEKELNKIWIQFFTELESALGSYEKLVKHNYSTGHSVQFKGKKLGKLFLKYFPKLKPENKIDLIIAIHGIQSERYHDVNYETILTLKYKWNEYIFIDDSQELKKRYFENINQFKNFKVLPLYLSLKNVLNKEEKINFIEKYQFTIEPLAFELCKIYIEDNEYKKALGVINGFIDTHLNEKMSFSVISPDFLDLMIEVHAELKLDTANLLRKIFMQIKTEPILTYLSNNRLVSPKLIEEFEVELAKINNYHYAVYLEKKGRLEEIVNLYKAGKLKTKIELYASYQYIDMQNFYIDEFFVRNMETFKEDCLEFFKKEFDRANKSSDKNDYLMVVESLTVFKKLDWDYFVEKYKFIKEKKLRSLNLLKLLDEAFGQNPLQNG